MAQALHETGLSDKASEHFLVVTPEYLDGHHTLQRGIIAQVHISHATFANELPQFIPVKGSAL
jgi:hypothetical protein